MGYKTWSTGEIVTAANMNTEVRDQLVTRVAVYSTLNATIPSPVAGMIVYAVDQDILLTYTGGAWIPLTRGGSLANNGVSPFVIDTGGTSVGFSTSGGWAQRLGRVRMGGVSVAISTNGLANSPVQLRISGEADLVVNQTAGNGWYGNGGSNVPFSIVFVGNVSGAARFQLVGTGSGYLGQSTTPVVQALAGHSISYALSYPLTAAAAGNLA